ncbi:MAG: EAL domain-containing protein [Lachnospiraceae bacterium]|nr:EAL domain-containing protein [Lachnospiraceae bacterium]
MYCLFFKDVLLRNLRFSLYLFMIICIGSSLYQFFHPLYLIENFAITFCLLLIYLNLQRPEDFIHDHTGALNDYAFSKNFLINQRTQRQNRILFLCIEELSVLNYTFTPEKVLLLLSAVTTKLEHASRQSVYYLGNGAFAIMYKSQKPYSTDALLKRIKSIFESSWDIDSSKIDLEFRTLELSLPKHGPNLETVYLYLEYLQELDNSNHWSLSADDISIFDTARRQQVEAAMKWAIDNDGFEVYYQPIYSTGKNSIASAEALIRLRTEELGFIPPDEFIPLAEQNGMILKIGHIVFDKVFRFMSENSLNKKGIEYVEINLSMIQCMQEGLSEELISLMQKYHIDGKHINLEITETAAATSPKMLIQNMTLLSDQGITFSLDDFGTGYSNITSLLNLPLSIVKFDKSMIDMASGDDTGKMILDSSTAMIKQMNLNIVAEGIETMLQKETLVQSGIDYLQGYFFSRPVPGPEFLKYIEEFNCV